MKEWGAVTKMQPDATAKIGNSLIQHGPANDRVYLMKSASEDMPDLVDQVICLGRDKGYSKLFAKVSAGDVGDFESRGFIVEARIPNMCRGESTGYFMSRYLNKNRACLMNEEQLASVLKLARSKGQEVGGEWDAQELEHVARLGPEDAEELAALYGEVFETYPFDISNPAYIRDSMNADVVFFGLRNGTRLVAASSAELDHDWKCAEMTDFATLPECRGQGAAGRLLACMERDIPGLGIRTAFTIARAESPGMNAVFARGGYSFGGTLCNNTQIGGKLESMNVWHKAVG